MDKTTDNITPGGRPGNSSENPSSSEAGLTDSGGGQSLLATGEELRRNSDHVSTNTIKNKNVLKDPEWKEVNTKKRHRLSPEERASKQHLKIKKKQIKMDYWLNPPAEASNKYSLLDTDDDLTQETSSVASDLPVETVKQTKPPPIFVAGVGDINPLYQLLEETAKENYTVRVISQTEVKIQANTMEVYDTIVIALKSKNTEFHSYQKKQDKPFKVVLRNMHGSSDLNLLKSQIEDHGHNVININNIRHRVTKSPLPMFYINLKSKQNNKDIYKIEYLLNTKIYFEPPNIKREIPQCLRCQRYGHTKNFCARQPRCVKCAGDHQTAECPRKGKSQNVKCVLCGGNHPANYRGCQVYKELQKTKHPALRKKEILRDLPTATQATFTQQPIKPIRNGITFAQVLTKEIQQPQAENNLSQPSNIQTTQQSNDIVELKNMMKGLMEQMSTILNLLTTLVTKITQNG